MRCFKKIRLYLLFYMNFAVLKICFVTNNFFYIMNNLRFDNLIGSNCLLSMAELMKPMTV